MLRPLFGIFRKGQTQITPELIDNLAIHFRLALEELGPTFVKLGQLLSTRPDLLPPRYINELSKLQDTVPPVSWASIHLLLQEEYGEAPENLFYHIDHEPIAAASLAQVHAAILQDGERVVIKAQRPNITKIITRDLDVLSDIAERLQVTLFGKTYDLAGVADEFAFTLWNELDYRREGNNADRFRRNFAKEPTLYIPKIYWDLSTPRVLVMERISGIKIDEVDLIKEAGYDPHQLALNAAHIIIKEILDDGFFHADPHPGNLIVMPNNVIGAMDFGMVGYLNDNDRLNLIRLYTATVEIDVDSFIELIIQMGGADAEVDRIRLARDVERILNQYAGTPLKDVRVNDLMDVVQSIMFRYHLRLPSNYWLLAKTLVLMEGVGLRLDPSFDVFEVSKQYARDLTWKLLLPNRKMLQGMLRRSKDWSDLLTRFPRTTSRLLSKAESGDLFQLTIKDLNRILSEFDRLVTRLAISLMLSAIIIGMAMLTPLFSNGSLVQWLILLGFVSIFVLGVWFLISLIRSKKE
jgi:ubiquinone biosynthesis protein